MNAISVLNVYVLQARAFGRPFRRPPKTCFGEYLVIYIPFHDTGPAKLRQEYLGEQNRSSSWRISSESATAVVKKSTVKRKGLNISKDVIPTVALHSGF